MINFETTRTAAPAAAPARRIGQRAFWLLFLLEGLFVAGILLLAFQMLLPAQAPLAQSGDYATVRAAIQSRLSGAADDPIVEVAPGATAHLSSVGGFELNGYTYYYYREGQANFDPLSRGILARNQVELVAREQLGHELVVIYRVLSKERATR
jgi:hypothetical protein